MRRILIAAGLCTVLAGPEPLLAQEEEEQAGYCPEDEWPQEGPGHPVRCGREDFTIWLIPPRNPITVTANGLRGRADRTGQSVTVIDRRQIEAVQGPDMTRVMQRIAGITFTRNGPLGSFTGLSVRGSASQDVLVLIDGVRVNDVASPSGGFDLGSVTSGLVEQVELLRGPNSLIWGSGALGAVLNITTRDLASTPLVGSVELGSLNHRAGDLALLIGRGDTRVTVAAGYIDRAGFSAAAGGQEPDSFSQASLSARGKLALGERLSAFGAARFADGTSEFDGFPAPDYLLVDTAERQDMRQVSTTGGLEWGDGLTFAVASVSHSATRRDLLDAGLGQQPYFMSNGTVDRAELRARHLLSNTVTLIGGADREWSGFTDGLTRAAARSGSVHALFEWSPTARGIRNARLVAGGRREQHSQFGSAWTFAADGMVDVSPAIRLSAAVGEGFKAPSLFQLHSDYGNIGLAPERSLSFEAGVQVRHGPVELRFAPFRRDSRSLVDFVSCPPIATGICTDRPFGTYDNVGRARSQGVEAEGAVQLGEDLEAGLAYAFTASTSRDTGKHLARRPRHAGTATLDWKALETLSLGADLRLVSASFDDVGNTVRLGGHALLDLRASWTASDHFDLYARIENAWDEQYQTAAGYATQGRAAFVGVRARL